MVTGQSDTWNLVFTLVPCHSSPIPTAMEPLDTLKQLTASDAEPAFTDHELAAPPAAPRRAHAAGRAPPARAARGGADVGWG